MKVTPIKPSGIVLLTTNRCSAACDNCCFGCNPKQGRSMTYEEMKHYVDISIKAISSAISSSGLSFDSVAVPFLTTIIEQVFEHIDIAHAMYQRRKEGNEIDDIEVPDYPQLKELLQDLSYPTLWESMQEGQIDVGYYGIIRERKLRGKYHLDAGLKSCTQAVSVLPSVYKERVRRTGLSDLSLEIALGMIMRYDISRMLT